MQRARPYALGALLVAVLATLKVAVPHLADGTPFLLFFGAVLATAWEGGTWPGVFASLLGAVAANVFFVKAPWAAVAPASTLHTATFLAESVGITLVCERMRQTRANARASLDRERGARNAAREAEERARELLVDAPVGILVLEGPDNVVTFANAWYRDLVGVEKPEGKPFREVLPTVAALGVDDTFNEVRRTGSPVRHHAFRTCRDWRGTGVPEERFFDFTTKPVGTSGDAIMLALVEVTQEVRARREIERIAEERAEMQALAEDERKRLRDMLENAPTLMGLTEGPEHTLSWANQSLRALLGDRPLRGRPLREAFPELIAQGFTTILDEVYASGERHVGTAVPAVLDGGPMRFFSFVYEPVKGADGAVTSIFVLANEVTDLVEARQRESRARERAEEASRVKDEFLGTLSHELRTPLNAIVGWASILHQGGTTAAQVERAIETIERNARVQVRLIEDLLDVSRIVQGKLILNIADVDLARVVDSAVDAVRPAATAKEIRLRTELPPSVALRGDADRLQQIVWNLLSNAIKFTPRGGSVTVTLAEAGANIELAVSDDGQGITPEFLPHVFDRFRQADSSNTRAHGGLGLGLSIVRSLVELHGGTVCAESAGPGRGARFVVHLPTGPGTRALAPSPPVPTGAVEQANALAGVRVLCVDDEPDTRELLRHLLEARGATVTAVPSAEEALANLSGDIDVLVSDIGLPGRSGIELIREIRDGGRSIPAVALTAYARSEDRSAALRAGFDMHATKPVDPSALVRLVARLARVRRRP